MARRGPISYPGVLRQPAGSGERTNSRTQTIAGLRLFAPPGVWTGHVTPLIERSPQTVKPEYPDRDSAF
jgi:hypothetical protein